jgi:hypothetical protein
MKKYVNRTELAELLTLQGYKVSPKTLAKYAVIGGGPLFRKFGNRPLYTAEDGLNWAESKLSPPMTSTSQEAA